LYTLLVVVVEVVVGVVVVEAVDDSVTKLNKSVHHSLFCRSHSEDSIISSITMGAKTGCDPDMAKRVPVQPMYSGR